MPNGYVGYMNTQNISAIVLLSGGLDNMVVAGLAQTGRLDALLNR
jgi:asparagine synthetase B (glutamine-hydrolysing)